MSGAPVFVGTRVPFETLIDYLEAGEPLSESSSKTSPPSRTRRQSPRWSKRKKPCSLVRVLVDECLPRRLK
jgi:hypothetical protein